MLICVIKNHYAAVALQVMGALGGLQARGNDPTFHAAVDAMCELVWCTVDPQTNRVDPNMMPLIQVRVGAACMCVHPLNKVRDCELLTLTLVELKDSIKSTA